MDVLKREIIMDFRPIIMIVGIISCCFILNQIIQYDLVKTEMQLNSNQTILQEQLNIQQLIQKAAITDMAIDCIAQQQPAIISLTEQGIRVDCYVEATE